MATTRTRIKHIGPASPRLSIMDLLRRRKKTLLHWASELNIVTLASAEIWCEKMGVRPPTPEEWKAHIRDPSEPPSVSDPENGVIVIDTNIDTIDDDDTGVDDEKLKTSTRSRKKTTKRSKSKTTKKSDSGSSTTTETEDSLDLDDDSTAN